jgi:hypothetical protein
VVISSPIVATPPSIAPGAISTPKPPSHHQSSLLDIPPILTSSPNHTHLNKKEFDDELEELINFDDDSKDGNKINLSSDSLDKLLKSPEHAGEKKQATASRQLFSKENDKQEATKLSDLPGLSTNLGRSPKLDAAVESSVDDDPLLSVLNGSAKRLFGVPPLNSTRNSGLGELPPIGGVPGGAKKTGSVKNTNSATESKAENLQLSGRKPGNIQSIPKQQFSDIFSTEVPNYPEDFDDERSVASHNVMEVYISNGRVLPVAYSLSPTTRHMYLLRVLSAWSCTNIILFVCAQDPLHLPAALWSSTLVSLPGINF